MEVVSRNERGSGVNVGRGDQGHDSRCAGSEKGEERSWPFDTMFRLEPRRAWDLLLSRPPFNSTLSSSTVASHRCLSQWEMQLKVY